MADVLIKDMVMPTMPETFKQAERVPYIDVRIFADGTAVTSKCESPYYTQYSAVPVPPHGRLIDADALAEDLDFDVENDQRALDNLDIVGKERARIQFDKDCKQNCMWYLTESPTVIEASEDGEQDA